MTSARPVEHFVTLFDAAFLPSGLVLHATLARHAGPFRLWILCMDERVREQLARLALPGVELIPLADLEREVPELARVKPTRGKGEYCWTCTPFTFDAVFARDPSAQRVTYLDADLAFFRDPALLLDELDASGKDVLITDHAYDPAYDTSREHGRYCVQFLTCRRTPGGRKVTAWWRERCIEWCFNRVEKGKFGDQKYLDDWPTRFAAEVHVLAQVRETLAPWNARMFLADGEPRRPVFFHFHGLRIIDPARAILYTGYRVGPEGDRIYAEYLAVLNAALARLRAAGIPVPTLPQNTLRARLKTLKNVVLLKHKVAPLA